MTKIQELTKRILLTLEGYHVDRATKEILIGLIQELGGIAEAPLVVGTITDIPEDSGDNEGYSDNFLIDLNGWRKDFAIGHYDHDNGRWIIHDDDKRSLFEPDHMTWQRLPLAKYDEKK